MRLPTLNIERANAKNEEHRLQKSLVKDTLGFLSRDRENEQSNEKKTENEPEETTSKENVKLSQDHRKINRPFRVRPRVSGICFACTQLNLQNAPGMDLAKLSKSTTVKSCKTHLRKFSLPNLSRLSLEQNSIYDVDVPFQPSTQKEPKLR